ncbi:MAG TPA: bifunctional RNase H/acid phosphatase [Jatrophihabitans sp.]|nr:bifunctional RNase H/acid phosphatase [Jatrophihabitans sp.]
MSERVIVEADGGSRGNPGPAGYGAVVLDGGTGEVLAERSEAIGTATNNVAEYRGLIAGLRAAHELGARRVAVRMDSKLVVEQMKGVWQVKHPGMRELAREAAALRQQFDEVTFEWVPRAQNTRADRLANEAMDRAAGKTPRPRGSASSAAAPSSASAASARPSGWAPPTGRRTRLVLVRHGATEHSATHRLSGRNELPLDEVGRAQAAHLAQRDYGDVTAIVSSPLLRARQTADAIAARLGVPVEVVDEFVETDFGLWEGMTMAEAVATDPDVARRWYSSPDVAPPDGESFAVVGARVEAARDKVLAAHPEGTVVVVTHVTPIKWLVCAALEAPTSALFRLYLDTASVSIVDYYADGNPSVQLVNDTSHLR